jgi:dihydropteroate synthase
MMVKNTAFSVKTTLNCGGQLLDLSTPQIMGVLNVTPDSFYDGGKYTDEKAVLAQAEKMISEGAAIIDVGGMSTRPKAERISEEEEIKRIIPVIKSIKKHFTSAIISIDTFRSNVAKVAVDAGATIINDVSGGNLDKKMFETVAKLHLPYIMMHMQGTPETMQENPVYRNVTLDIIDFFKQKITQLESLGVTDIIIDPGFGFGKTPKHNFQLLKSLGDLRLFDRPILAGLSRKTGMIKLAVGIKPADALNATTVLNTIALLNGASLLRVHDVKEAIEVVKLVNYYSAVSLEP